MIKPGVVAWEVTRACNLVCRHCRAEAVPAGDPEELTAAEARRLLQDVASFCRPTFILTGGEPLLRPDVLDLARYGTDLGLRMVLSTNGTTLTPGTVAALKAAGIRAVSVSVDGATPSSHDHFRGVAGAFSRALEGIRFLREGGMPFQINTTVTCHNAKELPALLQLAREAGAVTWDVFLLVPTGRARAGDEIGPAEYEGVLEWLLERSLEGSPGRSLEGSPGRSSERLPDEMAPGGSSPLRIKVTCGPMYARLWRQRAPAEFRASKQAASKDGGHPGAGAGVGAPRGCLAGDGFAFISRTGLVFPCGYFPVAAGDVRRASFSEIYRTSPLFLELRDVERLRGKCGRCGYRRVCRGCRARALAVHGDYLAEEPYCTYQPDLTGRNGREEEERGSRP